MKRRTLFSPARAAICWLAMAAGLIGQLKAYGQEVPYPDDPAPHPPQVDVRAGGVLAESYQYHRQGGTYNHPAPPNITPAGGWYGYGFPVPSYRWGWFGAQRYYPRVVWHRGYYHDCCRWGYRQGY